MPELLAGFDVLVVPSRFDMRVLVSIEAMAAGAVIVVSAATAIWGPGDLVPTGKPDSSTDLAIRPRWRGGCDVCSMSRAW